MMNPQIIWLIAALVISSVSLLPLINSQHWIFRISDYIRLQLLILLLLLLVTEFIFIDLNLYFAVPTTLFLLLAICYHIFIVWPYFPKRVNKKKFNKNCISMLNINVMQENKHYHKLIHIIKKIQPDILLTMETDRKWEESLSEIEPYFKHSVKIPQDNRYGMHLYTTLDLVQFKKHYLISNEHPSIEVRLMDKNDNEFIFWGIHPPPPSPTEKPTSKQKDAELMKVAQLSCNIELPLVVSGDFNNVCWSKISKQFAKISKLSDARQNRGFYGTFPASIPFLRFPIDLLFHSASISINKLDILSAVGSDHLPLYAEFTICNAPTESKNSIDKQTEQKINEVISEGKKAATTENESSNSMK